MRVLSDRNPLSRLVEAAGNWTSAQSADRKPENTDSRWLAHGRVKLFFLNDGELVETPANIVGQSTSGARIFTERDVQEGDRFLIMDQDGREGEATAAWVRPEGDGAMIGARVAWIGRILPATAVH